jgi:hypothetical protein
MEPSLQKNEAGRARLQDTGMALLPLPPSLGKRTVSTPFLKVACAFSVFTLLGSAMAR